MIELIAEKQVATAAIQGKFSVEGISAMAEGVDARVALASSLADQDVKSGSALQKMFDVLHSSDKQAESYVTMQVYEELLGKEEVERRKKAKEDELFENLFGQWDEDFMDLQEPENGHRLHAGRGGVWLCHCAPGHYGLRDDARLQPGHLPHGHRHPESGAQEAL